MTLTKSETCLKFIPTNRFSYDSWIVGDPFMKFAVDLVLITFIDLNNRGYLVTEICKESKKILGFQITVRHRYLIRAGIPIPDNCTVGWLESLFFHHLRPEIQKTLSELVNNIFKTAFEKHGRVINPGKRFILEILDHQRFNTFSVEHETKMFTHKVYITLRKIEVTGQVDFVVRPDLNLTGQIAILRQQIKRELERFQDLS